MVLYYYYRMRFAYWRRHKDWKESEPYKCGEMYTNYKGEDKKSKIQVFRELVALSRFWKCYPESYFIYSMFKTDFTSMERMKSFVPSGAYARYCRNSEPKYQILIDDKILFHDVMKKYNLPVTERFFSYRFGNFKRDGQFITDAEVDNILAGITDNRIFIKRNMCGEGSGISVADKKEDGFYTEDGIKLTAHNIRTNFKDDQYLFEKMVVQDQATAQFNPSSLNTCRIITYNNKAVACGLRIGRAGSYIDNAAKGGIVVSVDMETGRLGEFAQRRFDTNKYYEHPDTHVKFKDVVIPHWKEIIDAVNTTCKHIPYYSSVGFDVACTPDGPVIIEVNTGTGSSAPQLGKEFGTADCFLKA